MTSHHTTHQNHTHKYTYTPYNSRKEHTRTLLIYYPIKSENYIVEEISHHVRSIVSQVDLRVEL